MSHTNVPLGDNFRLMSYVFESSKVIVLHIDDLKIYNIQTQKQIKKNIKIFPMDEHFNIEQI